MDDFEAWSGPLVAWHHSGWIQSSGTATVIKPGLAITAKHVIDEILGEFHIEAHEIPPGEHIEIDLPVQFRIRTSSVEGETGWGVSALYASDRTDIVFLRLEVIGGVVPPSQQLEIDLSMPPTGSRVVAYGYPKTDASLDKNGDFISPSRGELRTGTVTEVHPNGRDRSMLPFPCFRTSAQFDGAMSGGPVLNELGMLCGIICSGFNANPDLNYVALIWPAIFTRVDVGLAEDGRTQYRTLREMAEAGSLTLNGWELTEMGPHGPIMSAPAT